MFEKAPNRRAAIWFFGWQAAGELRDSENRRRTISGKIYLRRLRLFGQQSAVVRFERKVSCGPSRAEAAARIVLRTVIFTCVSLTRGRSDFGQRAAAATKRKESETF